MRRYLQKYSFPFGVTHEGCVQPAVVSSYSHQPPPVSTVPGEARRRIALREIRGQKSLSSEAQESFLLVFVTLWGTGRPEAHWRHTLFQPILMHSLYLLLAPTTRPTSH